MEKFPFYKFHGAGNDFVIMDNRAGNIQLSTEKIAFCCHRRFGIGADGFILIENATKADFAMRYFNADGKEATLCGNGSRCSAALAHLLQLISKHGIFVASDGLHRATVEQYHDHSWMITIEMKDIDTITNYADGCYTDTGSPHFVVPVADLQHYHVDEEGQKLRFDPRFPQGTNVDFMLWQHEQLHVRTYERGVEAETLSCGTGVTASALLYAHLNHWKEGHYKVPVSTFGGNFTISFNKTAHGFTHILLTGPVKLSFTGEIYL